MKTTDINTLSIEALGARVKELETQLSSALGEDETDKSPISGLWDIVNEGLNIYHRVDDSYGNENAENCLQDGLDDIEVVIDNFTWAQNEKKESGPKPLEDDVFYYTLVRLFKLQQMYRKLRDKFRLLKYDEDERKRKAQTTVR